MRERERERERDKNTCSLENSFWNILFRTKFSFQKKDKNGRVQRFLVDSPTIFICVFLCPLFSLSIYFVPVGVNQVLRKVTESVLSHNSALSYVYIHVLIVKLTFF